jgi:hypothetical protein
MERLDLQVTERARAWIASHLSSHEPESVLALSYGSFKTYDAKGMAKNETSIRWRYVVFTKAQAAEIEKTAPFTGEGIYITHDGTTLCIPERKDLERLAGKTLDAVDGALVVSERAS